MTILAVASAAGHLSAQDGRDILWQPVDQAVSDLDLRAASTRRVEQGIGVYGQSGSLYRRDDLSPGYDDGLGQPFSQQYQLRRPGFTAWLDRPDYLVRDPLGELKLNVSPGQDGRYIDLIPPNTVFDLVPHTQASAVPYVDPYSDGWDENRLDTRYDGVVTGDPAVQTLPPPRAHRLPEHLIAQREARAAAEATPKDDARDAAEHVAGESEPDSAESTDTSEP